MKSLFNLFRYQESHPDEDLDKGQIMHKLIAYGSKISHSSVERAGLLGGVKMRLLEHDEDYSLRGIDNLMQ